MTRTIGILIGVFYAFLSGLAITSSIQGWFEGHADLGLWWAVIGTLLGIACLGAIFGTLLHTRTSDD